MSTFAHVAMKESRIAGNVARFAGGGLSIDRGSLTLTKSTVVDNTAGEVGGGVDSYRDSRVQLGVDSVVARNSAKYGGGIANDGVLLMQRTAEVRDNTARWGGGIGTYAGARSGLSGLLVMRQHASVTGNSARYCGGIETTDYGGTNPVRVRMSGTSTVSANVGGGVCLASTALVMRGRSSVATNRGGGILAHDAADWRVGSRHRVVIHLSGAASVSRNSGTRGAGIFLEWAGGANCATCSDTPPRMVLQDRASVTRNTASVTGGGIYVKGGSVVLRNRAAVVKNSPDDVVIRPRT
jgi:predicted outer membrane repeat protein